MVVRLSPDQKVACSIHVGFIRKVEDNDGLIRWPPWAITICRICRAIAKACSIIPISNT